MSSSKKNKRQYKSKTKRGDYDNEWNSFLKNMRNIYGMVEMSEVIDDDDIKNEFIKKMRRDEAAKLIKIGYLYTDYFFTQKNRKYDSKELNDMIKSIGYEIIEDVSIPEIAVFYNKDRNIYSIVHRGTQIQSQTGIIDIMTDLSLLMGGGSQRVESRIKETRDIVEYIKSNSNPNQNAKINLIGHSLGSFTSSLSMMEEYNLKNIDNLITLNGAFFDSSVLNNKLSELSSDDINELNKKSSHYRMEGDIVSLGSLKKSPFGDVITYGLTKGFYEKQLEKNNLLYSKDGENMIDLNVVKNSASHLYAHKVDRFLRSDLNPINKLTPEQDYFQDLLDVNEEYNKKHPSIKNIKQPMRRQEETRQYIKENKNKKPTQTPPMNEMMEEIKFNLNNIFKNQEKEPQTKPLEEPQITPFEEIINNYEKTLNEKIRVMQINNEFEKVFETDETIPINQPQPLNIDPFSLCKIDPTLEGCENFI